MIHVQLQYIIDVEFECHWNHSLVSKLCFPICNLENHPSCGYTTTDQRDLTPGDVIHLTYWVIYAQAVDFKPVMSWTVNGARIDPDNTPPDTGDGQYNYSSSYDYTLPRTSSVTFGCRTQFEVHNVDKDPGVDTNQPDYDHYFQIVVINVKS